MQSFREPLSKHLGPCLTVYSTKPPVVRGARACTVCRAAKVCISPHCYLPCTNSYFIQMKCVGAEDGQKPCQRCKRANVEYVTFPFSSAFCSGLSFQGASLKNIVVGASLVRSEFCVVVSDAQFLNLTTDCPRPPRCFADWKKGSTLRR